VIDARDAGTGAAVFFGGVAAFQLCLAAGAPWGAAAWGGQHPGVLPSRLRRASAVSAVALAGMAVVAAQEVWPPDPWRRRALRGAAAYLTVGVVANAASRSPVERAIWTPGTAVGAALTWRAARG
jgi:hypothetical protein